MTYTDSTLSKMDGLKSGNQKWKALFRLRAMAMVFHQQTESSTSTVATAGRSEKPQVRTGTHQE